MATLDYVEIPSYATRLHSSAPASADSLRPAPKILTSMPHPERSPGLHSRSNSLDSPLSPSKAGFNLPQMLLMSSIPIPANVSTPRSSGKGGPRLLSTRDPLSVPITTVNFRRFVPRTGVVFWLQDRLEEIVMWRKGWKYTIVWMSAYAFLCYFPRLVLLLPLVGLAGLMLTTYPSVRPDMDPSSVSSTPMPVLPQISLPSEGSSDWLANIQAIQNLMGAFSDVYDAVISIAPHLIHASPYTPIILTLTLALLILFIPLVNLLPMRIVFFVLGLFPFVLTHPFTRHSLYPYSLYLMGLYLKPLRTRVVRIIDDDNLQDIHWRAEMREVELWENERWSATTRSEDEGVKLDAGWSKVNLKSGERKAWTRGRDGWSGLSDDGNGDVSSNLTFSLSAGWIFVETEDWRPDLEGTWAGTSGADDAGWVYTNDTWLDPHPAPLDEWKTSGGITRRRRWVRRIYYNPTALA